MEIKRIFEDGESGLKKYNNLIGIGVILTILLGVGFILFSLNEQKALAEKCGFDDGKIRCVCTDDAWNQYQEDTNFEPNLYQNPPISTKGLNTSQP